MFGKKIYIYGVVKHKTKGGVLDGGGTGTSYSIKNGFC